MRRNVHGGVLIDIARDFSSAMLGNKTTKAAEINILIIREALFDITHKRLQDHTNRRFVESGRDCDFVNKFSFSHNYYEYILVLKIKKACKVTINN